MRSSPHSLFIPLMALLSVACAKPAQPRTEFVLGTVCTVNLYERGTESIYTEIFLRLRNIEMILSANRDDTNISEINRNAGVRPVKAAPETLEVLRRGIHFAELSGGHLDPTIGPLVKLWKIGTEQATIPANQAISDARTLIDYRRVIIDAEMGTVYLPEAGMMLDLGAIAKGYAADEVAKIAESRGIHRAIIDLGGNIFALGSKAPGTGWKVGIRNPENDQGGSVLALQISDKAVVTSGVYERFFVENGTRYHHLLNPYTGFPEENGLLSVSIVTSKSIDADALSTSLFLLGLNGGMKLAESLSGVEALFIDKDKKIHATAGLRNVISVLDEKYALSD